MQASDRISNINLGGSDGWEVFNRARQLMAEDHNIVELTIGEHDIKTHPSILNAMHEAACAGQTGYASVPGSDKLRDLVAARVQSRTGVVTTRDNVMITPGGQAGLFAAHLAACNERDKALYVEPYYATYPSTIRSLGLEAISIPTKAEDAFEPQEECLRSSAKTARSLLINSPNNPSGTVYSRACIDMIARVSQETDLWLISDEVYDTQVWSGEHISPRAMPNMTERCLVIGSMSKSHAMTGSRVGWIVGPEHMIDKLIDLATNMTYGIPGYIQEAAYFALSQGPEMEKEVAAPFARRRSLAMAILEDFPNVSAIDPRGAMYLMVDIRKTGLSGDAFANKLLDEHQIAVMPGESFGRSAAGHLRVAMTIEDRAFEKALRKLCSFANDLSQDA